jgi:putative Ca2+/H+ antiporter (TMEM165/GDT1 family)
MLYLLLISYLAVFTGELIGDKLLYTIGALATRYRMFPMLCGVAIAFMGKMGAAVIFGGFVSHLPGRTVALSSAASFFTMALTLSLKAAPHAVPELGQSVSAFRAALMSFSLVFLSEWGDLGQITAATLAARYQSPLTIWLGGTIAMITKAVLAMTFGVALRNRISQEVLRYCGVCLFSTLGVLSLLKAL